MSVLLIPLEKVLPNPYQTRESEDPEHIQNLAASIGAQGMLQIPAGRIASGQQGKDALKNPHVQLAFGHSRLAAYKLLNESGRGGFDRFPVMIVELDDRQMFENAVAENLERKNLTPIEEARAMQKYQVEFKKNSKEVGELFHLSDSAVRNKMRLLGLPEDAQIALKEHRMTEGAARELLTWYDLPEEFRKAKSRAVSSWQYDGKDAIAEIALEGVNAEKVHSLVSKAIEHGRELAKAPWKWDKEVPGTTGICKGCPYNIERDGRAWCVKEGCFDFKKESWIRSYLSQASLLSGIPVIEEEKRDMSFYLMNEFHYYRASEMETLKKSMEAKCENLRLVYDNYPSDDEGKKPDRLGAIGFPQARIICSKRSGYCTCMKAAAQGINITTGEDGKLDTEALKEINRARRQQEKLDNELIDQMEVATKQAIFHALQDDNLRAWVEIARHLDYGSEYIKDLEAATSVEQIWMLMAGKRALANRYNSHPEAVLRQFNRCLAEMGIEALPWELEPPVEEKSEYKPLYKPFIASIGGKEEASSAGLIVDL